ncbi:MAG TPA: phosphotransferase [Gaiellaceae bacterium]
MVLDGVDKLLRRYPDSPVIEDLLGTLDAGEIRARVRELEPDTAEIFYFAASVGALFGVRRRDGSRVAIKVNKLFTDERYFAEVQQLQAKLADAGYPAPRPVGRVGTVTIDEWLDDGEYRNAHEPDVRRAMARELVRFHGLATETGLRPRRAFLRPEGALWPKPHNALFDFEATAAGAEWIDEIATASRAITDTGVGAELVGHTDWSAKHLRFSAQLELMALYDWDSVTTDLEPSLVGTAAGSFTYTEELGDDVDVWPSAAESQAFIAEYEEQRGEPFDEDERAATRAACVYLRAYAARCHHAFEGDARESGLADFAAALL